MKIWMRMRTRMRTKKMIGNNEKQPRHVGCFVLLYVDRSALPFSWGIVIIPSHFEFHLHAVFDHLVEIKYSEVAQRQSGSLLTRWSWVRSPPSEPWVTVSGDPDAVSQKIITKVVVFCLVERLFMSGKSSIPACSRMTWMGMETDRNDQFDQECENFSMN